MMQDLYSVWGNIGNPRQHVGPRHLREGVVCTNAGEKNRAGKRVLNTSTHDFICFGWSNIPHISLGQIRV